LAEKGECRKAQNKALRCLGITLIVSLPASVALYFLAPYAAKLLFGSLGEEGLSLLVLLVKVMAVNAVTSSLVQTSSACLTALGKPKMSAVSQWTACILRVMLTAALLGIFHLSALGAAIAANCSFLVAFILNFCYIIKERNKGQRGRQS
jgi:stage V sporulation protein B